MNNAYLKALQLRNYSIYSDPVTLQHEAFKYFYAANERYVIEQTHYKGEFIDLERPVIFTLPGLLTFLGITLSNWKQLKKLDNVAYVCEYIETLMLSQNLELASAGMANANITKLINGLADKVEVADTSDRIVLHLPDDMPDAIDEGFTNYKLVLPEGEAVSSGNPAVSSSSPDLENMEFSL